MDSIPEYNKELFSDLLISFWDIFQYKIDYETFIGLDMIESYIRLFDRVLHPVHISLILSLDKEYTSERNTIIYQKD